MFGEPIQIKTIEISFFYEKKFLALYDHWSYTDIVFEEMEIEMEYLVGNSIIRDRAEAIDAAIEWWATARGTYAGEWDEDDVRDHLPGWCRVRISPGEALEESAEQERFDNDLVERALEMIREARRAWFWHWPPVMPRFYLVRNGTVCRATPDTPWDGEESILVYATSPRAALRVADAYDKGEVQPDNVWLPDEGRAVAAAFIQRDGSFL